MHYLKNIGLAALTAAFLFFGTTAVSAAVFAVTVTVDTQDAAPGDGFCADGAGGCSLRAAITEANALAGADTINVPAGTYTITIAEASDNANANGDFDITSDIAIIGSGSATTVVEANTLPGVALGRVFHIRALAAATTLNTTLSGMTVRHGRYNNNTFGGGIRIDQGTAHQIALNDLIITGNLNGSSGGGVAISGSTGAVTTNFTFCVISGNNAGSAVAGTSGIGGGVMINVAAAVTNFTNTTIINNTATTGLATTNPQGGGLYSLGTTVMTDSFITTNTSSSATATTFAGGAMVASGTLTLNNTRLMGNASTSTFATGAGFAGGIYNQQATLNLNGSQVMNNTASHFHAGIRTLGQTVVATTNITDSTVSGNVAATEGGGVVNISGGAANSTTNILRSTVSANRAVSPTGAAGGLENFSVAAGLAAINVGNSTVSSNLAATGAGSYNSGTAATINFDYSTIASNVAATSGGGLFQDPTGATNLRNTVVADNTAPAGPDISGTITSQDYNHVENTAGGVFAPLANDLTGTDPQLGPLANNGGPTQTHLPAITSPVIDTIPFGTSGCGTTTTVDQRGAVRSIGPACEKGSVEVLTTSAQASLTGRVATANGAGIRGAIISISGGDLPNPRFVTTSSFGYYGFDQLSVGQTYVITVNSKRYVFTTPTRVIQVNDNLEGVDFIAEQ